jgi:rhodanese-related sulfurtransferase
MNFAARRDYYVKSSKFARPTMKMFAGLVMKAVVIAIGFASMGLMLNLTAAKPIPWVYAPPKEVVVAGVKVQFIDEKAAARLLDDSTTVFIDSRKCDDYAKSHVKGAVCMPPDTVQERYPVVEPLLPSESQVILYCYGPECDMAERVAEFLAQLGYRNMMIMTSGFAAWEKADLPVENAARSSSVGEETMDGPMMPAHLTR